MTKSHIPEASISTLVVSLASSASMALGLVENPTTKKKEVDLTMAQFNIDLILLLKEKTKGNLNDQETQLLDGVIRDLQMQFVQAKQNR